MLARRLVVLDHTVVLVVLLRAFVIGGAILVDDSEKPGLLYSTRSNETYLEQLSVERRVRFGF